MLKNSAAFNSFDLNVIFEAPNRIINIDDDFNAIGIMTDSRLIESNNIFVAIKGDNFDGHDKINEAFVKGSSAAIIDESWFLNNQDTFKNHPLIIVEDTIVALGKLAKYHRYRFKDLKIITVAGSNGKTSTKEMIASVLEQKYKVLKTHSNFNNQIGVPLMLLQINEEHEVAVLEIGTNMPGEILTLTSMIKPSHGIITNIGKEHLEQLLDIDGVELEETSMFAELRSKGHSFINYDDERLKKYGHILEKFTTYGEHEHSMIRGTILLDENLRPEVTINWEEDERKFKFKLKTIGKYSALNAIAASAVGLVLKLDDNQIINGLENFTSLRSESGYGRMHFEICNGIKVINDTYNSNPSSAESALNILKEFQTNKKKIAVLGDMLELGESAAEEHISIIVKALDCADELFIFGPLMHKAYANFSEYKNIHSFESDKSSLKQALSDYIRADDVLLVKGSRGTKMEEIINYICKS